MKIAFTSCARYSAFGKAQPVWGRILDEKPDYVFLLGDQIYMDYGYLGEEALGAPAWWGVEKFLKRMREKYEEQWQVPGFRDLLAVYPPGKKLFAIWDDHDFAWNNAYGCCVPDEKKIGAREIFHEYLPCTTNPPEVYFHIDLPTDKPIARVFFLDNRFHTQPPERCKKCRAGCPWQEDAGGALFGREQVDYLERHKQHPYAYTLFCAGLTATQGSSQLAQWNKSYARFCEITECCRNPILLAGDIHDQRFCLPAQKGSIRRPFHEVVSSGAAQCVLKLPFGAAIRKTENWALLHLGDGQDRVEFHSREKMQAELIHSGK